MRGLLERLREVPIEWLALVFPFLVVVIVSAFFLPYPISAIFSANLIAATVFESFFSILFFTIAFWVSLWWLAQKLFIKFPHLFGKDNFPPVIGASVWRNALMIFLIPYLSLCTTVIISAIYATAEPTAVHRLSALYTDWDQLVFGPLFYAELIMFVGKSPIMTNLVVYSYYMLVVVIGVTCVVLAARSLELFRKYVLAFFMCFIFSLPLWIMLPAVSPTHYLLEGVLDAPVATDHQSLQSALFNVISEASGSYRYVYDELVVQWGGANYARETQQYAITTNPSMHVAWGWFCVFYLSFVSRRLGIVVLAYQLLNILGTILLLQHYSIDIVTGTAVAVLTIVVVNVLMRFEKRTRTYDEKNWFAPLLIFKGFTDTVFAFSRKK